MPLSEKVTFTAALQRRNRVVVPKLIRWQFRMETSQVLNVGVNDLNTQSDWHFFYARMSKDGRIYIPQLILTLLQEEDSSLAGHVLEVTLEPGRFPG